MVAHAHLSAHFYQYLYAAIFYYLYQICLVHPGLKEIEKGKKTE